MRRRFLVRSGLARRARRSLALRWVAVAAAAGAVAVSARSVGAEAVAAREAWGAGVAVAVATGDLDAGEVVGAGDVRVEERPAAVVPEGALTEPPVGRTVTAAVLAGEVLVEARVAPGGVRGVAALVPRGWLAVAVPTSSSGFGTPSPPLDVGDRVDVLAPDPVAENALVVAVGEDAVTIAVPARDAGAVAEAVAVAVVTLALRGPG